MTMQDTNILEIVKLILNAVEIKLGFSIAPNRVLVKLESTMKNSKDAYQHKPKIFINTKEIFAMVQGIIHLAHSKPQKQDV